MRKLLLYSILFFVARSANATIWPVDNSGINPGALSNLQNVIDNYALSSDTIMVSGSPNSYGDISITKPLTIIGSGYNNLSGVNTIANYVHIQSSNVFFTGFNLTARIAFEASNAPGNNLTNVTVERCSSILSFFFEGGPFNNPYLMQNITIRNTISENAALFISQNTNHDWILFDSLIMENNIFYLPAFYNWGGNITGANTIIVRNNLFANGDNGQNTNTLFFYRFTSTNFHDAILYNNIFYDCNPTGSVNCTFMNNLTYGNGTGNPQPFGAPFGTGSNDTLPGPVNNNIYSQDPAFVNYAPLQPFSYSLDFHLNPGSPCLGTGLGGTDIGIYGGLYPFNVGAGPDLPVVDFVNIINPSLQQTSTLYLQFDARVRDTNAASNNNTKLIQAEYWIDSFPLQGRGGLITLIPADTINYYDSIPGLQLDSGAHYVSVRVKDNNGNWSLPKTDSVRNKYYNVDFSVVGPPFLREGAKTKFTITINNRSSVDLVERYIVMQSPRDFNAEFENVRDSINSVAINNISNTIFVDGAQPHYDMPLWIGKLKKNQSVSYDFYVTFPSLVRHGNLTITYQLLGSEKSEMQGYFENYGTDSSIFRSLYAHSLLNTIDVIKDTLGLDTLSYTTLNSSLKSWFKTNNSLFTGLFPLNSIGKPFFKNNFNVAFTDSIADIINLAAYNVFKFSTYNVESIGSNNGSLNASIQGNLTLDCNCPSPLNLLTQPCPPLQPTGLFDITSGCQERCKCECFGFWKRQPDYHKAIDIALKESADLITRSNYDNCLIPVQAIYGGTVWKKNLNQDEEGGYYVIIKSRDNFNNDFFIEYAHLCENGRPDPGTIVFCGTPIGFVGSTGFSTGTHLHVEVYDGNGQTISPSCLMDFNGIYPPSDIMGALVDQPCKLLGKTLCEIEIEAPCIKSDPIPFSDDGTCPSYWIEKDHCDDYYTVVANDPNDKIGNEGYAPQRYIKSTEQLHYGIFFQNTDTSTGSAQVVTIFDTLDLIKVDKHSFYFESITAGNMLVVMPDSIKLQNIDSIYKAEPINGTYVHIKSTFDSTTGVVRFTLTSLDTTTILPVTNALDGFLPPDTSKFHGNGLVSYKVTPISTIPDDTVIYNTAHIIFDNNTSIATGTWFNTIDRGNPSSSVNSLPSITYDSSFVVNWTGTDHGSGISVYDIYYKRGTDTVFTKWLSSTSLTSATFDGIYDSTYQFYSIAYDSVLNVEDPPLIPDATTLLQRQVVPLTLLSFTAKKEGKHNVLSWTTTSEINVDRFEIERSITGNTFTNIGSINGGLLSYAFTDDKPENAINYYRLRMIDKDGRFTYSPVKSVNNTNQSLTVYPNPVTNKTLNLNSANALAGKYTFELFTIEGKLLFSKELTISTGSSSHVVHLPATIASGSYIVKVQSANETKVLQQLVFVE